MNAKANANDDHRENSRLSVCSSVVVNGAWDIGPPGGL
jgi:hypothetical protein